MTTVKWTPVHNNAISSDWNLILNFAADYDISPTCRESRVQKEQVFAERHFCQKQAGTGFVCGLWMAEIDDPQFWESD